MRKPAAGNRAGAPAGSAKPTYFRRAADFRAWLSRNYGSKRELLVGFHKVGSGKASMTYPEALDAALCFGWIDGIRRSLGATSYTIRFTPRKPDSIWSAVNLRHVTRLRVAGLMHPHGLEVFLGRDRARAKLYSFENGPRRLSPEFARALKADRAAWTWFRAQTPTYRRVTTWWVMSAKKKETRARRLAVLIASSARGAKAPPFAVARKDRAAVGRG